MAGWTYETFHAAPPPPVTPVRMIRSPEERRVPITAGRDVRRRIVSVRLWAEVDAAVVLWSRGQKLRRVDSWWFDNGWRWVPINVPVTPGRPVWVYCLVAESYKKVRATFRVAGGR